MSYSILYVPLVCTVKVVLEPLAVNPLLYGLVASGMAVPVRITAILLPARFCAHNAVDVGEDTVSPDSLWFKYSRLTLLDTSSAP